MFGDKIRLLILFLSFYQNLFVANYVLTSHRLKTVFIPFFYVSRGIANIFAREF